jgi:uncharacterized protein YdeI (BOF family)
MKYIEIRTDWSKKLSALSALGIVAFAPLFGASQSAQAQPPGQAPAWGYRNRNNTQSNVITGVVTSNSGSGFVMRTDTGRTLRVQTNYEPRNLTTGDRVTVSGRFSGGTYIADSVRVIRDRDDNWNGRDNDWNDRGTIWNGRNVEGRRVTAIGVVTRDLRSENAFDMRTDSGLPVRVRTRANEPRRLSVGDRVEVTGVAESGRLRADSVRLLNDRNPNDGDDRTLTGVVTRDLRGDTFEVRTAAGRTVIVRARETEPVRLTRGDRVFLQGRYNANRGEFVADRIRITENDDRDVEGSRVSFPATVTAVDSATRLQVRGDNGRTYTVDTRAVVSSNVDPGDRVRVSGTIRSGIVRADRIELTDRGTRVPNGRGRLDFSATVIDGGTLWGANVLTVRGDNGREFRVSVPRNSQSNFRRGDRVRVVGIQLEDNRIQATSVTRL